MTRQLPDPAAAQASGLRTGRGRRAGLPARGQATRDVGGERGQFAAGPRGERPARPHVELVPGQPPCTCVLQRLDHLLAVGVGRPEPVTARRGRVFRSCHHRPPLARYGPSVTPLLPAAMRSHERAAILQRRRRPREAALSASLARPDRGLLGQGRGLLRPRTCSARPAGPLSGMWPVIGNAGAGEGGAALMSENEISRSCGSWR